MRILFICGVLFFSTVGVAFATPVHDMGEKGGNAVVFNDIRPLTINHLNNMPTISENIDLGLEAPVSLNNEFVLASQWSPTWFRRPRDGGWWGEWHWHWPGCPHWRRIRPPGNGEQPAPVPEPATMLLFGSGLVGLAMISRKKLMK